MKKIISFAMITIMIMSMLVGCAKSTNETSKNDNNTNVKEEETSASVQPTETSDTSFPITYTDARGKKVTIEKKPTRIAVSSWMITEKLLAMEKPPIASDTVEIMSTWESMKQYFEQYQIADLGTEVNLEKLLEQKPDLILATTANEAIYDQLESIAPVVVFDVNVMFGDWQNSLREVSMVIGEEKAAEAFISSLMSQITQSKESIAMEGKSVAFLRLWSKTVYSMGISTCAAYYDNDNGLGLLAPEGWTDEIGELSLEALAEMNPEYIFISTSEDETYMQELSKNTVWNNLTAVKEGHVYTIDLSALSGGALAAQYGVQVVSESLTK